MMAHVTPIDGDKTTYPTFPVSQQQGYMPALRPPVTFAIISNLIFTNRLCSATATVCPAQLHGATYFPIPKKGCILRPSSNLLLA